MPDDFKTCFFPERSSGESFRPNVDLGFRHPQVRGEIWSTIRFAFGYVQKPFLNDSGEILRISFRSEGRKKNANDFVKIVQKGFLDAFKCETNRRPYLLPDLEVSKTRVDIGAKIVPKGGLENNRPKTWERTLQMTMTLF